MSFAARLGVDIGQQFDPTALAAVQVRDGDRFTVRHLGRLPLLTDYVIVAERIVDAAKALQIRVDGPVLVVMDATGVGRPILDMVRTPLREANIAMRSVLIVAGDQKRTVERTEGGTMVSVGKAWMVSRLISLFQSDAIDGPPGHPELKALQDELLAFQIRAQGAHDSYGAANGKHDDLVIALALAVLDAVPVSPAGLLESNGMIRGGGLPSPDRLGGVRISGWTAL